MGVISSVISLKDRYTSTADKVAASAGNMGRSFSKAGKEVAKTESTLSKMTKPREIKLRNIKDKKIKSQLSGLQSQLRKLTEKNYELKITEKKSLGEKVNAFALAGINKVKSGFFKVKKVAVDYKELIKARRAARKLGKELSKVTGKKYKASFEFPGVGGIGSKILNGFKGIGGKIGGILKAGAIAGIAAAVSGAIAFGGQALSMGMDLEDQKISMQHFLGGDEKKTDAYISALRKNANKTPFETGEVIAAGTRAVQIADGDTEKGMQLVKMAEDMAALTPGKTISDAMEALADMQMGEMERMKEFGFKGSKEAFDAAGGDITKMRGANGKTIAEMFEGGAGKLSGSARGKISTIVGNLKSGMADAGLKMLERLKPILDKLIPKAEEFAEKLPKMVDSVMTKLSPIVATLGRVYSSAWGVVGPTVNMIASVLGAVLKPALQAVGWILDNLVVPAFDWLSGAIETVIGALSGLADFIGGVIGSVKSFGEREASQYSYKKVGSNASGAMSWRGGLTEINELGPEMVTLPRGSKIVPQGRTDQMLSKSESKTDNSQYNFSITLNDAGNVDPKMLVRMMVQEMKRQAVNVA